MAASRTYREIERARATRFETLELVEGLGQERAAFKVGDSWSVGEVLDHLLRVDEVYFKNIEKLLEKKKSGKLPFIYRGISTVMPLPKPLRMVAPFFELPLTVPNSLLPSAVRHRLGANRALPLKAPKMFEPRPNRPIEEIREDLRAGVDRLDELESEPFDLRKLYYYNPVLGLATIPGAVEFLAVHELRHQGQLRDALTRSHGQGS